MAAAFLPATCLRLTLFSPLRFLSFFPIFNPSSYSLFRPLRRRVPPLLESLPAIARRRCFCSAVSEAHGSGKGKKVKNNYDNRFFGSKVEEFRRIAEVKGGAEEGLSRVGKSISIMGWVRTQSSVTFYRDINDGSCQCVMNPEGRWV